MVVSVMTGCLCVFGVGLLQTILGGWPQIKTTRMGWKTDQVMHTHAHTPFFDTHKKKKVHLCRVICGSKYFLLTNGASGTWVIYATTNATSILLPICGR